MDTTEQDFTLIFQKAYTKRGKVLTGPKLRRRLAKRAKRTKKRAEERKKAANG